MWPIRSGLPDSVFEGVFDLGPCLFGIALDLIGEPLRAQAGIPGRPKIFLVAPFAPSSGWADFFLGAAQAPGSCRRVCNVISSAAKRIDDVRTSDRAALNQLIRF